MSNTCLTCFGGCNGYEATRAEFDPLRKEYFDSVDSGDKSRIAKAYAAWFSASQRRITKTQKEASEREELARLKAKYEPQQA